MTIPILSLNIATTRWNLQAALAGAPFIHRFDLKKPGEHVTRKIRFIDDPDHPCYLVWCGEWLVYDATDEGADDMRRDLLMVVVEKEAQ